MVMVGIETAQRRWLLGILQLSPGEPVFALAARSTRAIRAGRRRSFPGSTLIATSRPSLYRSPVTCLRWYVRFSLSLRDVKELMAERDLSVDHTSVWRGAQGYSPEVHRRLKGEVKR